LSSAGAESGRGAFSNAIIEGLSGKADIDRNHVMTARELCDYVIETRAFRRRRPRSYLSGKKKRRCCASRARS